MESPVVEQEIARVPAGEWIILSADEQTVVAHHSDLRVALEQARKVGVEDPVVMKAASSGKSLVIADHTLMCTPWSMNEV